MADKLRVARNHDRLWPENVLVIRPAISTLDIMVLIGKNTLMHTVIYQLEIWEELSDDGLDSAFHLVESMLNKVGKVAPVKQTFTTRSMAQLRRADRMGTLATRLSWSYKNTAVEDEMKDANIWRGLNTPP